MMNLFCSTCNEYEYENMWLEKAQHSSSKNTIILQFGVLYPLVSIL